MKRLTTDTPDGNFETMLNYVYGKDGFAHIRFDSEQDEVPLTSWAKAQCLYRGCDDFPAETPEEIDETLCECVMDCPECPIALAYCFACQAVHLRSRLKMYEDILFDGEGKELVTVEQLKTLVVPLPKNCHGCKWLDEVKNEPDGSGYCCYVERSKNYKPGDKVRRPYSSPCELYEAGDWKNRWKG